MDEATLAERAKTYLQRLCIEIPDRRVGSVGNRAATDFFAEVIAAFGFETESPAFECIDWCQGGAHLTVDGEPYETLVSPYSLGGYVRAALAVVSTMEELEAVQFDRAVLLVRGDLAREPLMPKHFTFYNPDRHKRIVGLLEDKAPQAIVAATSRNPETAGAVYPFPLIEDGDFDIPSVHMTEEEGTRLAQRAGEVVSLDIRAMRAPAVGCNVIARRGTHAAPRAVVMAHVDTKGGTPGALDNGGGVVVLLLLAELLRSYSGKLGIEIVAMNGEDDYSSPGQLQYLARNTGRFDEIVLGINLDGVGYREGKTAYSLYGCPPQVDALVREVLGTHPGLVEGPPWYQGDHSLLVMNQVPSLALTSARAMEVLSEIVHTPRDRPEVVDVSKLVQVASALSDLLPKLDRLLG
jgi:aminopeptidase YwaD